MRYSGRSWQIEVGRQSSWFPVHLIRILYTKNIGEVVEVVLHQIVELTASVAFSYKI